MPRRYNQFCALARALDVVGERWTLLIVRELLLGPRRFTELLAALPGMGRNLLAARLRELEEAGVLERAERGYRLTARGQALRESVFALTRWEMEEMRAPAAGDERRPGWYALAMWAAFRPEAAPRDETYELRVGGETFHLEIRGGDAVARRGPAPAPAATLATDLEAFLAIVTGLWPVEEAVEAGRARASGSRAALRRCLRCFGLPVPAPAA